MSGYGQFASHYLAAGWSPLPLPHGLKTPPPNGWTGYEAPMATEADVAGWAAVDPNGNIALRMPDNVVGIDYDAYKADGVATMAELVGRLGALPTTWRSSSRGATPSGIYFFRLPDGLPRIGDVGKGIETIRHGHRYAVVAPSLHPEGGTYTWFAPDGGNKAPAVADLPWLPASWVQHLVDRGERKMDARADLPATSSVAYEALSESEKKRIDSYLDTTLNGIHSDLAASASWGVGETDTLGRGWEKLQADKAIRLAALALADWNDYTLEQARSDFVDWCPTGDGWRSYDVEQKFVAQSRRATPQNFPEAKPQADIFAGLEQPAPAAAGAPPVTGVRRPFDDRGLAERAYEEHRGKLLYLRDAGTWARWTGHRWETDKEAGERAVQRTVEETPNRERPLYADMSASDYGKLTSKCRLDRTTATATNYLRKTSALDANIADFDQRRDLLLVGNGVVDLRTGNLLAPDPTLLMLRGTSVPFDPAARSPEFEAWLAWAQPDPAMRHYLQIVMGATLTGEPIKRYWIHEGERDAGKSMLVILMMAALGDNAVAIAENLITGRDGVASDEYARASLRGARLAALDETKAAGHSLDTSIKKLVGGAPMTARNPTERPFTFRPTFKLHIATNNAPTNSPDKAIASRLEIIRWDQGSTPEMRAAARARLGMPLDAYLERFELQGILAWAVRGAAMYYAGSEQLPTPASVVMATDAHMASGDLVSQWISEATIERDEATFTSTQGWHDFKVWQDMQGERVYQTHRAWGLRMNDIVEYDPVFIKVKAMGVMTFRGRALRSHLGVYPPR